MPNNNYRNGYALERKVKLWFESRGYLATRAAGSHGFADVWATNGEMLVFIQCKKGASVPYAQRLAKEMKDSYARTAHASTLLVAFQVVDGFECGEPRVLAYEDYHVTNSKKAKTRRA